jgi:hypothetical protein
MKEILQSELQEVENNLKTYFEAVKRDHKTRLVREGFSLYAWFWFNTEFWQAPLDRRPYTYIFRDWIYPHMKTFLAVLAFWYAGLFFLAARQPYPALGLAILSSLLAAHLVWGSRWKKGEQEWPPYLGE